MAFPISYEGTMIIPRGKAGVTVESTVTRIRDELKRKRAGNLVTEGNRITFTGGMMRLVTSANPLVTIDKGELEVSESDSGIVVAFRLKFTMILISSTLFVLVFYGPISWLGLMPSKIAAIVVALFLWFIIFGMQYLLGMSGFKKLVRRSLLWSLE